MQQKVLECEMCGNKRTATVTYSVKEGSFVFGECPACGDCDCLYCVE